MFIFKFFVRFLVFGEIFFWGGFCVGKGFFRVVFSGVLIGRRF